jgi:hypothetical protein
MTPTITAIKALRGNVEATHYALQDTWGKSAARPTSFRVCAILLSDGDNQQN